jgi:hypothetical protein
MKSTWQGQGKIKLCLLSTTSPSSSGPVNIQGSSSAQSLTQNISSPAQLHNANSSMSTGSGLLSLPSAVAPQQQQSPLLPLSPFSSQQRNSLTTSLNFQPTATAMQSLQKAQFTPSRASAPIDISGMSGFAKKPDCMFFVRGSCTKV